MPRFSITSLHARLGLLVVLVMAPALLLTFYSGMQQRRHAAMDVQTDALRMAQIIAAYQEQVIERSYQIVSALGRTPSILSGDVEQCNASMARLLQKYDTYSLFAAIEPNGDVFCSAPITSAPVNVSDRPWFGATKQERNFVIGEYAENRLNKQMVLPFAYPVIDDDDELQAVVVAGLDMGELSTFAGRADLPPNSIVLVLDETGTVLARHPEAENGEHLSLRQSALVGSIQEQQGEGTAEITDIDGIPRLCAFTKVQHADTEQGVYVTVGIPSQVAFERIDRMMTFNLSMLLLIVFVELIVAAVGSTFFILRPINALVSGTQQLSQGKLTTRISTKRMVGELYQLATSFNHMAEMLQQHEANNREAESRYRTLVEQIPSVIYTSSLSAAMTIHYISPRIEALTGYTPDEWQGSTWIQFLYPEDKQRVLDELGHSASTGEPFRSDYRLLKRDGHVVWVRDEADIIYDDDGQPSFMQGTMHDITEQKEADEIIHEQQETLRELSTPLLHIGDRVMLMPLIGAMDSYRAQLMMESLLKSIEQQGAKVVILDITGVAIVDSQVANALIQTANAIRLLGAQAVLTGVRPEVAQTLVGIGIDLSTIVTHSTLQNGIAYAMRRK